MAGEVRAGLVSQDRYEVLPVGDRFAIRDMRLRAFCSLDGVTALRWETRHGAQRWLNKCYGVWGIDPAIDQEPPPASRWGLQRHHFNPYRSPWEGFTTPVDDSRFGT